MPVKTFTSGKTSSASLLVNSNNGYQITSMYTGYEIISRKGHFNYIFCENVLFSNNFKMTTKAEEDFKLLEIRAEETLKLIKSMTQAMGLESRRFQDLQALYEAYTKMSDSFMSRIKLNTNSFKDIAEYHKLLTSQTVPRLNELATRATSTKLNLSKSLTRVRAKPS